MSIIIEQLPFLHCSLVHVDFASGNLLTSHVLLNHALKLNRDILGAFLRIKSTVFPVPELMLDSVVSVIHFLIIASVLNQKLLSSFGPLVEHSPELAAHLLSVQHCS